MLRTQKREQLEARVYIPTITKTVPIAVADEDFTTTIRITVIIIKDPILIFSFSDIVDQLRHELLHKVTATHFLGGNREEPKDMCTIHKAAVLSEIRVNRATFMEIRGTTSVQVKVTATEKGNSQVFAVKKRVKIVVGGVEQPPPSINSVFSVSIRQVLTEATRSTI